MKDSESSIDERVALLRRTEAFRDLAPATLWRVAEHLEPVELPAGTVLLRQDDAGDAAFLLASGRLAAAVEVNGDVRVVNEIAAGQLFGEMALLTRGPRTVTVQAVRDSIVLRLHADLFEQLAAEHPSILRGLATTVVNRLQTSERRTAAPRPDINSVAVVPAGRDGISSSNFCRHLVAALSSFGPVARLTRQDADARGPDLVRTLHELEAAHRFVVYEADEQPDAWTQRCVRQADLVLLVGDSAGDPGPSPAETVGDDAATMLRKELVLVHRGGTRPDRTSQWLDRRSVQAWHHVREGHLQDFARLGRAIVGRQVGLVLGGGGPRGFAHLGVMRALDELGVPVDIVGGTSMGAIMGAAYAMGWDPDERDARLREAFGRGNVIGWTFPLVSLSSGAEVTRRLSHPDNFGRTHIDDLWVPFFCVSTNLSRAEAVLHERGMLWRALRASVSIPGVLPPVYSDGDLLVDGAMVNNLPVDEMRKRTPGGTVIAVDVEPDIDLRVAAPFPAAVSGWRLLGERLRRHPRRDIPSLLSIAVRSKEVGGRRAQGQRLAEAGVDLVLRPPTHGTPLLDFRRSQSLIDTGYEYAIAALQASGVAASAGRIGSA